VQVANTAGAAEAEPPPPPGSVEGVDAEVGAIKGGEPVVGGEEEEEAEGDVESDAETSMLDVGKANAPTTGGEGKEEGSALEGTEEEEEEGALPLFFTRTPSSSSQMLPASSSSFSTTGS
jgi:hypothetical protein